MSAPEPPTLESVSAELARLRRALAVWSTLNGTGYMSKLVAGTLTPEEFLDDAEVGYKTHIERCRQGIAQAQSDMASPDDKNLMGRGLPVDRIQRYSEAMKESERMLERVKEARKL